MPNNIQNKLEITTNHQVVKKFLSGPNGKVDFNKILPQPKDLDIESGSHGEMGQHILYGKSDISWLGDAEIKKRYEESDKQTQSQILKIGKQYQENLQKYGHTTWYDWRNEKWGTKWNAYALDNERDTDNIIYFQTAWSAPKELIRLVSTKFLEVRMRFQWADEDTGYNVGDMLFLNGDCIQNKIFEGGSKESYDLAFELWPGYIENYKLVDGNYEYSEE